MTDARWQQVKALFQATVDRPPSERAAFLAAAVGGDEALRREVESLLERGQLGAGVHGSVAISQTTSPRRRFPRRGSPVRRTHANWDALHRRTRMWDRIASSLCWARRDGRGVPRTRQQIESRRGAEGAPERLRIRSGPPGAIQARGSGARRAQSSAHCGDLRARRVERPAGLVLELVEGVTLAKRIEDGPLPFVEALTIGASDSRGAPGCP